MTDRDDERRRKAGETNLQWRLRIEQMDADERRESGPILTRETERHGDYAEEFVMHIETMTLARTKRNRLMNPFKALYDRGVLTKEQLEATTEIAMAAERIQCAVSVRGASLEARVDNMGDGRDSLVERLALVRLEVTYSRWRQCLPTPKRMILAMLLEPGSLASKARRFHLGWPVARAKLLNALDLWIDKREQVMRNIDEAEVLGAQNRVGGGIIL